MKKLIILSALIIGLASCKKESDICGDSTFDFKLYGQPTTLIAYVNGNLVGEFGNDFTYKAPAGQYVVKIIQQRTPNLSTIVFLDTIELQPCKDIFSYKY